MVAAAAKSLQSCPTLCDPIDGSPPGSPSLGFSRQEHWSGLPFPSPMRESASEVAQSYPCIVTAMQEIPVRFLGRVISWLWSPSAVILEPKKIKSLTVSIFSHLFAMK